MRKESITKLMSLGVGIHMYIHIYLFIYVYVYMRVHMHMDILLLYFAIHASHNDPTWQAAGCSNFK